MNKRIGNIILSSLLSLSMISQSFTSIYADEEIIEDEIMEEEVVEDEIIEEEIPIVDEIEEEEIVEDEIVEEIEEEANNATRSSLNVTYHSQSEIQAFVDSHPAGLQDPVTFKQEPSLSDPYNSGVLSDETAQSALNMLNQIRFIAGINANVTYNDSYAHYASANSFVNALNGKISHYPTRPSELSGSQYNTLFDDGYKGGQTGNLACGKHFLNEALINQWMADQDSSNIDRVGHRRWVINPKMGQVGFGSTFTDTGYRAYHTMYAHDTSQAASQTGVAWPAQEMPTQYFDVTYPWSVSMGRTITMASTGVKLTRLSDNAVWNFSSNSSDGFFNVENSGYGQIGCIIFRPNGLESISSGDQFKVEISLNNGSEIVEYNVNFFDLQSAHVHVFSGPVFNWSSDYQSCTGTFTCVDGDFSFDVNCTIEHKVNAEATCTTNGSTTHKVSAYNPYDGYTWSSSRTQTIRAYGHDYTYTFVDDTTHSMICNRCNETSTGPHDIENSICKLCHGQTSQTHNHSYFVKSINFRNDYTECYGVVGCSKCDYTENVEGGTVTSVVTDPTCTERGYTTIVGKVYFPQVGLTYSTNPFSVKYVPAKGHSYVYKFKNEEYHVKYCSNCNLESVEEKHSMDGLNCTHCDYVKEEDNSILEGYSLALSGEMRVKFYIHINGTTYSDKYGYVLLNDAKYLFNFAKVEEINGKEYYVFDYWVKPKEMTKPIDISVCAYGETEYLGTFTLEDYANYLMSHYDENSKEYKLAYAILNYGYATQMYFDYNTNDVPGIHTRLEEPDLSQYAYTMIDNNDSLDFVGARLRLTADHGIELYFIGNADFEVGDEEFSVYQDGQYTVVSIGPVVDFYKVYTITADNFELNYSMASYGNIALHGNNDVLKQLISAMESYFYNLNS